MRACVARSSPGARPPSAFGKSSIASGGAALSATGVMLNIGGSVHDPNDPIGRLLFYALAMIAEFRIRPDQDAHPRGYAGRQGQRPTPG
jgi:hypothetical protein